MAIIGSLFFPSTPPEEILWDLQNALLPEQILKEVLRILRVLLLSYMNLNI